MKVGGTDAKAKTLNKDDKKEVHKKPALGADTAFKKNFSGVEIYIEKYGEGPPLEKGKKAVVHYEGYLEKDWAMFDSSRKKKKPFEFVLGNGEVIPGWEEALNGIKEGSKIQIKIPAKLAYGERGVAGLKIPPRADLVFKIDVVKVKEGPPPPEKTDGTSRIA